MLTADDRVATMRKAHAGVAAARAKLADAEKLVRAAKRALGEAEQRFDAAVADVLNPQLSILDIDVSAEQLEPVAPVNLAGDPEPVLAGARERVREEQARPSVPAAEVFAGLVESGPAVVMGSVIRTSYGTGPYVVNSIGRQGARLSVSGVEQDPRPGKRTPIIFHLSDIRREADGRITSRNGADELCVLPPGIDGGPGLHAALKSAGRLDLVGDKDVQRAWMRGEPLPKLDAPKIVDALNLPEPKRVRPSRAKPKVTKVELANGPATIVAHPGNPLPDELRKKADDGPACVEVSRCRVCGCTDDNCAKCVRRTGLPCSWATPAKDLCSACAPVLETDHGILFVGLHAIQDAGQSYRLAGAGVRTVGQVLALDPRKRPPRLGLSEAVVRELKAAAGRWVAKVLAAGEPMTGLTFRSIPGFPPAALPQLSSAGVYTVEDLDQRVAALARQPGRKGVSRYGALRELRLSEELVLKVGDCLEDHFHPRPVPGAKPKGKAKAKRKAGAA